MSVERAEEKLLKTLLKRDSPRTWTDLEVETGLVPRVMNVALKNLVNRGLVTQEGRRGYQITRVLNGRKIKDVKEVAMIQRVALLARDSMKILDKAQREKDLFKLIEQYDTVALGTMLGILIEAIGKANERPRADRRDIIQSAIDGYLRITAQLLADFWLYSPEYEEVHLKVVNDFLSGFNNVASEYIKNRVVLEKEISSQMN